MISDIVKWVRDTLGVEAFAYEIPKAKSVEVDTVSITRVPGGPEPRGAFRTDQLNAWLYSPNLKTAEALYERFAEELRTFKRIVNDQNGMVVSLKEAGSAQYNIDEDHRSPHVWVPLNAIISRRHRP